MYELMWHETKTPDFSGFAYYVEEGSLFDADDFCDAFSIDRSEVDPQDIHSVQDAAGRLNPGTWLWVSYD